LFIAARAFFQLYGVFRISTIKENVKIKINLITPVENTKLKIDTGTEVGSGDYKE
jgi:hypothetical protein